MIKQGGMRSAMQGSVAQGRGRRGMAVRLGAEQGKSRLQRTKRSKAG